MPPQKPTSDDPEAPFGYEIDGVTPVAPYGLTKDGRPRRSQAGRPGRAPRPPRRTGAGPASSGSSSKLTKSQKKEQLVSLVNSFAVPSLVAAAIAPPVVSALGESQAMALAGDAFLISSHADPLADGLIALSETHPNVLAWMDNISDKAPYLVLLSVGLSLGKAIIQNHSAPSPQLAQAGLALTMTQAAQAAQQVQDMAAAAGVEVPPVFTEPAAA